MHENHKHLVPNPESTPKLDSTSDSIEQSLSPEALALKIAQAFLRIKYPLSEQGVLLRDKIKQKIEKGENIEPIITDLPTVENPRPELFADFTVSPEIIDKIMADLACIQTSKGCSHKCTFCAAGAAGKVTMMPFPAILKMAEIKRQQAEKIETLWQDWVEIVKKETDGLLLLDNEEDTKEKEKVGSSDFRFKRLKLKEIYKNHGLAKFFPPSDVFFWGAPLYKVRRSITNYYDSDPFDYRDGTFLHSDGTPADYGDAVKLLANQIYPIYITTAGWNLDNKLAKKAALKIVGMDRRLLSNVRISVNPYEQLALRDIDSYGKSMIDVIETLRPVNPEILLYDAEDFKYTTLVDIPIEKQFTDLQISRPIVSSYSGHVEDPEHKEDPDVMSCMPGYFLEPKIINGTINIIISYQKKTIPDEDPFGRTFSAPKGSRPTPTGEKLW